MLSEKHGFTFNAIAVDHPGQEQKSQWLQIRRERPDYVLMWGWGVMNSVAVTEAANIGFPMENFIGVWWSGAEPDVLPAGAGADGYKAINFTGVGMDFPFYEDLQEHVLDAGKGAGDGSSVGTVQYNRGIYAAMLASEAARNAQEIHGTPDITPAMMRDGMEALKIDAARLEELGMTGFGPELEVTCANHGGPGRRADDPVGRRGQDLGAAHRLHRLRQGGDRAADRRGRRRLPRRERHRAAGVPGELTSPPPAARPGATLQGGDMLDAGATETGTLLEVNNIEVIYNHVILVLKGVSLSVREGGITALLGGNGAGKTTTLKAISNLLRSERGEVTKGRVLYRGEDVGGLSPADLVRRGVIQVMEGRHCFEHLTIEENLLTGAYTRKDGGAAVARRPREGLRLLPAAEGAAAEPGRLHLAAASSRCARSAGR